VEKEKMMDLVWFLPSALRYSSGFEKNGNVLELKPLKIIKQFAHTPT